MSGGSTLSVGGDGARTDDGPVPTPWAPDAGAQYEVAGPIPPSQRRYRRRRETKSSATGVLLGVVGWATVRWRTQWSTLGYHWLNDYPLLQPAFHHLRFLFVLKSGERNLNRGEFDRRHGI